MPLPQVCEGLSVVINLLARRSLRPSFLLLAGFLALLAVACGSDDSPDPVSEPAATEAPTATTAEATTATQPATEASTEAPNAGGSVDERYVRSFCVAGNDLQMALLTAATRMETEEGLEDDPEAFAELFVGALVGFLEAMREVTPPDDLAQYHTAFLVQYEGLVGLFEAMREAAASGEELEGDPFEALGGMLEGAEEFPALPEAALARLAHIAEGVPECASSLFLAEFLGPGEVEPVDTGSLAEVDPADEQYVRDMCLAGDAYEATFQEAMAQLGPDAALDESDPEVFAAVFLEALRGLAADMQEVSPPDGVASYHAASIGRYEEMVAVLDDILETSEAGGEVADEQLARFQQLLGGGVGMTNLPLAEANRLAQAANNVIECSNSGFLYGFLGGGRSG